jgi:hypothetical protein
MTRKILLWLIPAALLLFAGGTKARIRAGYCANGKPISGTTF